MKLSRFLHLAVLCSIAVIPGGIALAAESTPSRASVPVASNRSNSERILIKNIYLTGREGEVEDLLINILLVDGKLKLVTEDSIAQEKSDLVLDAEEGYLLGKLALGDSPSFIIVDNDPSEHFEILLDTARHAKFSMYEGSVLTNYLPMLSAQAEEDGTRLLSWTAYNPPPMAVPLNYYHSRKWNKFETRYISGLFNGALAMDRLEWLSQDDASRSQLGDLSSSETGEVRGLRFGLLGTLNFETPWVYTFLVSTRAFDRDPNPSHSKELFIYDMRLDIPLPRRMTLSVGKQKEPISLERLTMLLSLPWQERYAAVDAFTPARNHGITLNGTLFGGRSSWAAGVFNNWIDSDLSFEDTSDQFTWRVTGLPFVSEDKSNLLHLGIGMRYSNAKPEQRAKAEAEFFQAPVFVDTGAFDANDILTTCLEAYWRKGPYLLGLEFLGTRVDSPVLQAPFLFGYSLSGSWIISGEMRPYRERNGIFDPVPVARPVNLGGWGAWEVAARYSFLDLDDGELQGGAMDTYSLGLNWWLAHNSSVGINYRYIILERFDTEGHSSGFNIRLAFLLD